MWRRCWASSSPALPARRPVTPLEILPGYPLWSGRLEALVAHGGPLFIYGDTGCGVSTLAGWLAEARAVPLLDDAEAWDPATLETWLAQNPGGVLGSHQDPSVPELAEVASRCLAFHLPSMEDDPGSMERCLGVLALAEGLTGPLPPPLATLPCPGNLRGLRNRLVRYKLLGQLPEDPGPGLPLEKEDLASNLHVLERILLHRALRRSYGNRVEAARRLGVSRRQLYLLIARHGDPVRGEAPSHEGPKRLSKRRDQNSRISPSHR